MQNRKGEDCQFPVDVCSYKGSTGDQDTKWTFGLLFK
jgi:hypothetical protein